MKNAVIYVHGKGGSVDEADHYKKFYNDDYDVIGFASHGEVMHHYRVITAGMQPSARIKYNIGHSNKY